MEIDIDQINIKEKKARIWGMGVIHKIDTSSCRYIHLWIKNRILYYFKRNDKSWQWNYESNGIFKTDKAKLTPESTFLDGVTNFHGLG